MEAGFSQIQSHSMIALLSFFVENVDLSKYELNYMRNYAFIFDAFLVEQEWYCVCEAGKHCTLLVKSCHSIDYYYLN